MPDKIFLAIAVEYTYSLPRLKGAIPSAKALYNWALTQDYQADIVTDEDEPVTTQRVKNALQTLLGQGGQDRIIISFAGHGITQNGTEDLWLLSDWLKTPGAIDHAKMRLLIERYRPVQVGIISDACRSFATKKVKGVEGSAIVDNKEYKERSVQRAIINGTLSGYESFSTPVENETQYCFLSKVTYDALRGELPWGNQDSLSNDTFYKLIEDEVPELAKKFKVKQKPDPQGSFRTYPNNVWSTKNSALVALQSLDFAPPAEVDAVIDPEPSAPSTNPGGFGGFGGFGGLGGILGRRGPKYYPTPADEYGGSPEYESDGFDGSDDMNIGGVEFPTRLPEAKSFADEIDEESERLRQQLKHVDDSLELLGGEQLGITINGATIVDNYIGTCLPIRSSDSTPADELFNYDKSAPSYLIKLDNGDWCGAAYYSGYRSQFLVNSQGVSAFSLSSQYGSTASEALRNMAMASLGHSFGNPYDNAAQIRAEKHIDPVLGAIAAYSYYQIGEIDEIRRMAYYYAFNHQAIPFDIAMLAQLELKDSEFGYYGEVPGIEAREPKTWREEEADYTHAATNPETVLVAGRFPWLTRGWSFVDDNRNASIRALEPIAKHVSSSLFTTLSPEGGPLLLQYLKEAQS